MEKNIEQTQTTPINVALLVCLVGFPQISETIYTPSLTEIASSYHITLNVAQMTLSIYFLAFAFGVFFWGISADYFGRRKAMTSGLLIYIIGCLLCLISNSVGLLFLGRFVQAFGASTGSVTTQTILRDNYQGRQRHQLFAKISAALAFSPAIGPLVGGVIGQYQGFRGVFLALVLMGLALLFWTLKSLPETGNARSVNYGPQQILTIGKKMVKDPYTMAFGLLIGLFNGLLFSYHAEAPAIFIDTFKVSQSQYGLMGCVVASATVLGAWLSNRGLKDQSPEIMIERGIYLSLVGCLALTVVSLAPLFSLALYISGIGVILGGIGMALPNCLSLALTKFSDTAGTAGAFLSLGYYVIVSLCTFLIGIFHTGSLLLLPLFCLGLLILSLVCIKLAKRTISHS